MQNLEALILVDETDQEVGTMEKMEAHEKGLLHRAFSVFVFNSRGDMLLQQRAIDKYHCGGLWTNACCSHPRPNELTENAATRRLQEELGFTTQVEKIFDFTYRANFDNGLTEHEYDHVFIATYDGPIVANPTEVADYQYAQVNDISNQLKESPNKFTPWFHLAFPKVKAWKEDHKI